MPDGIDPNEIANSRSLGQETPLMKILQSGKASILDNFIENYKPDVFALDIKGRDAKTYAEMKLKSNPNNKDL